MKKTGCACSVLFIITETLNYSLVCCIHFRMNSPPLLFKQGRLDSPNSKSMQKFHYIFFLNHSISQVITKRKWWKAIIDYVMKIHVIFFRKKKEILCSCALQLPESHIISFSYGTSNSYLLPG